jgi:hypothetical protein
MTKSAWVIQCASWFGAGAILILVVMGGLNGLVVSKVFERAGDSTTFWTATGSLAIIVSAVVAYVTFLQFRESHRDTLAQTHRWKQAEISIGYSRRFADVIEEYAKRLNRSDNLDEADQLNEESIDAFYQERATLVGAPEVSNKVYTEFLEVSEAITKVSNFYTEMRNSMNAGILDGMAIAAYTTPMLVSYRVTVRARAKLRGISHYETWTALGREAYCFDVRHGRDVDKQLLNISDVSDTPCGA